MESKPIVPGTMTRAYEHGQFLRGLRRSILAVVFVCVAAVLGAELETVLWLGVSTFLFAWFLGWRGQSMGRGVFPGLLLGSLPFLSASAAQAVGHVCTPSGCTSLCAPFCTVAGAAAGVVLSVWLFRKPAGGPSPVRGRWWTWLSATSFIVALGALGCGCLGMGSILGMLLGHGMATGLVVATTQLTQPQAKP